MSKLIIVESPAKAKTIKKYMGSGYDVTASMGHVRDLPKSKLGVDIENRFTPQYVDLKEKKDLLKDLKARAAAADKVYLATDPDREGEAISWHLAQVLALNLNDANRVTFNEITKTGVKTGMAAPRKIDIDLVDAQQARRILDRIVGYKLSPFLWKKVKGGLSAGRVQSVALRLIVEREDEIRAFIPEEYWSLDALFAADNKAKPFKAAFYGTADGKKKKLRSKAETDAVLAGLQNARYVVSAVKKGTRKISPAPPFITSTLQQEASRKLNFTGQRTMRAAQQLYEGVDIPGLGLTGLITYMRTDSLRISDEARQAGKEYITNAYGGEYLPEKDRFYKSRSNAQDAHEAIRPADPSLSPDKLKEHLTGDLFKLYKLIWERFTASLMAECLQDTVQADIAGADYLFRASGYSVRFAGFTVLYTEGRDDEEDEKESSLPPLEAGQPLDLRELLGNQHFTQPPPRFTEATLVKILEEKGIGRPSTYAPIIATITTRDYIEKEKKQLRPTALGEVIVNLLKDMFAGVVDVGFTADMEKQLDDVEAGRRNWVETLDGFYSGFSQSLTNAEKKLDGTRVKVPEEESDVECELCGRKMVIKSGRFGKFLACPGYPECKNTKPIAQATAEEASGNCPLCGGKILQKKSKRGYKFFACENRECKFITWDVPTKELCKTCEKTLFKRRGGATVCNNPVCAQFTPPPERKAAGETVTAADSEKASGKKSAAKGKPAAKKPAKS
ncbi:MAG: type I DNA topoisomerase [Oscillospiraceae bacterium]|nr:type I DNA topoisomerase [Oscillospiraceae bacterium]